MTLGAHAIFRLAIVQYLDLARSDHLPFLLWLTGAQAIKDRRAEPIFGFESIWMRKPKCENIIKEAWSDAMGTSLINDILQRSTLCRAKIIQWVFSSTLNSNRQIMKIQKRLGKL